MGESTAQDALNAKITKIARQVGASESKTPVSYSASPYWPNGAYLSQGTLYIGTRSMRWPSWTDYVYGPTTGPMASEATCNAKWAEVTARSSSLLFTYTESQKFTTTKPASTGRCYTQTRPERMGDPHTGPVTKLCDGITRALSGRETVTDWLPQSTGSCWSGLSTWTNTEYKWFSLRETADCKLSGNYCQNITETYQSRLTAWSSASQQNPSQTGSSHPSSQPVAGQH